MKVVLVLVSTINGKITKGSDPEVRHWSSKSDQEHYSRIWKDSSLIVLGSNTWNSNIIRPSQTRLIIVMTKEPETYSDIAVPGQLEFSDKSPSRLVSEYRDTPTEIMTVVGGSLLATSFLKDSLIDELWLTIEPRLFGRGFNLIAESDLDLRLRLIDVVRANEEGTLITKYSLR
ncbi:MAG TPA: dihydrofolate reductase family protein [Bacteroidales bacterium]|nr:dihydrofolate reductase family protein [Bacteroidales bacterium]